MKTLLLFTLFAIGFSNLFAQKKYKYDFDNMKISDIKINLGQIKHTDIFIDTLYYINVSEVDLSLQLERVPEYISVKLIPETLKAGEEGIIIIAYNAHQSKKFGYTRDSFVFINDNKTKKRNSINIYGTVNEDFSKLTKRQLANAPKIEFEKTVFDFDTIKQGAVISHNFKFKNVGESPLIIRNTSASCGCTASKPNKDTLQPGEESFFTATFNSRGKSGRQNNRITIVTNCPDKTTYVISLKGFVDKTK